VNPPEADLVGVEAVESQVAEDEILDRAIFLTVSRFDTRGAGSHALGCDGY